MHMFKTKKNNVKKKIDLLKMMGLWITFPFLYFWYCHYVGCVLNIKYLKDPLRSTLG